MVFFCRSTPPTESVLPGHRLALRLQNLDSNRNRGAREDYGGTPQKRKTQLFFLFFRRRNDDYGATRFSGRSRGAFRSGSTGRTRGTLRTRNRSRHRNDRRSWSRHGHRNRLHHRLRFLRSLASTQSKRGGNGCCSEYRIFHYRFPLFFGVAWCVKQDSYPRRFEAQPSKGKGSHQIASP